VWKVGALGGPAAVPVGHPEHDDADAAPGARVVRDVDEVLGEAGEDGGGEAVGEQAADAGGGAHGGLLWDLWDCVGVTSAARAR